MLEEYAGNSRVWKAFGAAVRKNGRLAPKNPAPKK
jgi:hypothetical protein